MKIIDTGNPDTEFEGHSYGHRPAAAGSVTAEWRERSNDHGTAAQIPLSPPTHVKCLREQCSWYYRLSRSFLPVYRSRPLFSLAPSRRGTHILVRSHLRKAFGLRKR